MIHDLDAEKNRHAQRNAHDIQRRQRRVPHEVAQAVDKEEAEHLQTLSRKLRELAIAVNEISCRGVGL